MKDLILDTLTDSVINFLHYDRWEDEELPVGAIQEAVKNGDITIEEMVSKFEELLREGLS